MIEYGFLKTIDLPFEEVKEKVTEALKKEGYGILTHIDVKGKFKEKLGVDFKRYEILGACNPKNAFDAIKVEENIGLLLPCNVIIYEKKSGTAVSFINPASAMGMIDNPALSEVAGRVQEQLKRAFDSL